MCVNAGYKHGILDTIACLELYQVISRRIGARYIIIAVSHAGIESDVLKKILAVKMKYL